MAALRAVLFDVDGVIVRNPAISAAIERRAVNYVRTRTKMSHSGAMRVNRLLYTNYGHTHTGMKAAFQVEDTIDDYNDYVYDRDTLFYCFRELARGYDSHSSQQAMQVISKLHEKGVPVYLFTNAPDIWADAVVQALDLNIRPERRITSTFGVKMGGDASLYNRIAHYVQEIDGQRDLVYVEDTFRNLTPILYRNNWQPVLFEPGADCDIDDYDACTWIGRTRIVQDLMDVLTVTSTP